MLHAVQRLGINAGGYLGARIDVDQTRGSIESAARRHGWTVSRLPTRRHELTLLQRPVANPMAPRLYFSAGMHGDEPPGPLAGLKLLEENRWTYAHLTVIPLLNPGGLGQNRREN